MTPASFITKLNYFARTAISDADGLALFNLVDQDLQTRYPWRVLQVKDAIVALTAGVGSLPDDFRQLDQVRVGTTVYTPIEYRDRNAYTDGARVYWLFGSQIGTPDSDAATLTLDYIKLRAALTDTATDSGFPASFDNYYIDAGLAKFWRREGNYGKASNHDNLAENTLQGLMATERKNIRARPGKANHVLAYFRRRF